MKVSIESREYKLLKSVLSDISNIQVKLNEYISVSDEQRIKNENTMYIKSMDQLFGDLFKNITIDKMPTN